MRVKDASSATVALLLLSWLAAGCHFDSQPLFEPFAHVSENPQRGPEGQDAQARDAGDASRLAADGGESAVPDADGGMDPITSGKGLVCTPDEPSACDAGRLLICGADGASERSQDCGSPGCNADAKRCNACRPDAVSCKDGKLVRCDKDGSASTEEACAMGCISTRPDEAECRKCAEGPAECKDGSLVQCAPDGQSTQTTKCAQGCDDRTRTCNGTLVPTNIPKDACRWSDFAAAERTFTGDTTLDTERDCPRVITQGMDLPELCVMAFEGLHVARGATLRVTGARALVLLATRSIEIDGRLSVSAHGTERGPGSAAKPGRGAGKDAIGRVAEGMQVGQWTNLPANAGGGGAGHSVPGAAGGGAPGQCGPNRSCAEPGPGGRSYGADTLQPLLGGENGGQNSAAMWSTRRKPGGGGGGALQLVACEELTLGAKAVLDANGGGGEGGQPGAAEMDSDTPGAGAGGGSGGAILLQARVLSVEPGALLVANGGGGGGGATRTGEGMQPMVAGKSGQDGPLSEAAAKGGSGAGASLAGGAGGAKDPPGEGGRARQRTQAAGGGGGSAGRIRIETAAQPGPRAGLGVSPSATYGTVLVE